MNEIGSELKAARISSSVSLEEASSDTEIPAVALEQIEEGAIGSFKDIFKLKDYLKVYSKYLGLDTEKIIDVFNEYMFEYTSKIVSSDIEKAIEEKEQQENMVDTKEIIAVSPYLQPQGKSKKPRMIITAIIIILLAAAALIWAIQQVS